MPQALKILCLAQVGRIQFSHFQPFSLRGNKNCTPSMKVEKLENLGNKIGLIGFKWSVLDAPGFDCLGHQDPYPFSQFLGGHFEPTSDRRGFEKQNRNMRKHCALSQVCNLRIMYLLGSLLNRRTPINILLPFGLGSII